MSAPRVRPFSNGTECRMWMEENCERCQKVDWTDKMNGPTSKCEIIIAVDAADWDDGTVSADIARRMGWDGEWARDCTEREDTNA